MILTRQFIHDYETNTAIREIVSLRCEAVLRADLGERIRLTEHQLARAVDEKTRHILNTLDLWSSPCTYRRAIDLREYPPTWIRRYGLHSSLDQRLLPGIFGLKLINHPENTSFESRYKEIRNRAIALSAQIITKQDMARLSKNEKRLLNNRVASMVRPLLRELTEEISLILETPKMRYRPRTKAGKATTTAKHFNIE